MSGAQMKPEMKGMKPKQKMTFRLFVKRYVFALVVIGLLGALLIVDIDHGVRALDTTWYTLREMLYVLPPIFILLGLLDVWVPRETMVRFMGEGSGVKGGAIGVGAGIGGGGAVVCGVSDRGGVHAQGCEV